MDRISELEKQLEQEREKVKGLHEITKVICTHCCEPMEIPSKAVLQTQLTQLKALVRALVGTKSFTINGPDIRTMSGNVLYACSSQTSAERLGALLEYRERTLDATTPAVCPDCDGDGAVDSGGTDPNGNPLMRRCGCREKGGDGE